MFCKSVVEEEIKGVLFLMDDNKLFGINGFFVCFFKKSWSIIKGDFCVVI